MRCILAKSNNWGRICDNTDARHHLLRDELSVGFGYSQAVAGAGKKPPKAKIRDTAMKVVFRFLPLIAPAVAVAAPTALGETNSSAFSYTESGSCLASPEGFNSKL